MHVAPQPSFAWLGGGDYRVFCRIEVFRRMCILRRVAASHVSAFQARPQMHPFVAHRNALRADVRSWRDVVAVSKVFAMRHVVLPLPDRMLPNPMLAR